MCTCGGPALPPLALPNNGALLLLQAQTASHTPSAVAPASLPSSGCFHTANPSPLPGTDLWSPKPESQLLAPA